MSSWQLTGGAGVKGQNETIAARQVDVGRTVGLWMSCRSRFRCRTAFVGRSREPTQRHSNVCFPLYCVWESAVPARPTSRISDRLQAFMLNDRRQSAGRTTRPLPSLPPRDQVLRHICGLMAYCAGPILPFDTSAACRSADLAKLNTQCSCRVLGASHRWPSALP